MSDWQTRLSLSKKDFEDGLRSAGRESGDQWAKEFADYDDLLAIKQLSDEAEESQGTLCAHELVKTLNADWEMIIPDGTLDPDVFAAAFVDAALGILSEVT